MKKSLFSLMIMVSIGLFAQSGRGSSSLEVGFQLGSSEYGPFSYSQGSITTSQNASTIVSPALKYRYFVSDQSAFRLELLFNSLTDRQTYQNPSNSAEGSIELKSSNWSVNLGYEHHLPLSFLSPYFLGSVGYGGFSNTEEWVDISPASGMYEMGSNLLSESEYQSLRLKVGAGIDIYLAKNIFIGTEFSFLYNRIWETKENIEYRFLDFNGDVISFSDDSNGNESYTRMNFQAYPNIRFGWRF